MPSLTCRHYADADAAARRSAATFDARASSARGSLQARYAFIVRYAMSRACQIEMARADARVRDERARVLKAFRYIC